MAIALVRAPRLAPAMCLVRTKFSTYRNGRSGVAAAVGAAAATIGTRGSPGWTGRVSVGVHASALAVALGRRTSRRRGGEPIQIGEDLPLVAVVRYVDSWARPLHPPC